MMTNLWKKYSYTIILLICSLVACFIIVINMGEPNKTEYVSVTVKQGETLWGISDEFAGSYHMSKERFINWVEKHNNITANQVKAGEELIIPVKIEDHQMLLASE
ncbi:MAG TPA: LysM peptidoglycan-binding domain-containing protein [Niallia sp.]|nr:LysM peptidoglycan-binding domain-containing protein [Niallia sp.]